MTVVWGALLGAGVVLGVSPWVWPRREPRVRRARAGDGRTQALLQAAGFAHAPGGRLVVFSIGAAALAAATAWLVTAVPAVGAVAGTGGAVAPTAWLRARARRIRRARRALWTDVCDLLIASVRAGMSLPDALASVAENGPPPLRAAFRGFARDIAASGHFDSSAARLQATLADPVADRIIETLRMARQVGGSELVPVLRALATSVRTESTLRSEIEARQSWIHGAAVLGLVAPWVILTLLALRPEGARAYGSPEGGVLILVGAAVSFSAYRMMLRIGRLPEPRRWTR
ncbi:type II secretion system F family protein [Microbacterium imperiale]|uniref:Type II secretion system protein F n=1 Tax=Microbacterium imperiale TaxID=33884 RepID=A0A9W6HEE5_9MICO|nr:type II secretion system F family protein [Microbacterium imperiale]MBP2419690.1 tight adherence protein B [Microbacterium imperiale]MDS0198444.1 type II secretion system F family protein [Microbacterium imperiale]BFE40031.1 type II secretion system F family protein [Microbacterium imperiale]GLJ78994.1 type II secretion system protein F [Microbacterium imperiale]